MDNESYFFGVLTYAIIYVLIHQIILRFYLLKYSLFFSSTLVLTSSFKRSLYTFYSISKRDPRCYNVSLIVGAAVHLYGHF